MWEFLGVSATSSPTACYITRTEHFTPELFMPVSGKVTAYNEELEDSPELVNDDPYGEGWLIKLEFSDADELGDLLDAGAYGDMVGG